MISLILCFVVESLSNFIKLIVLVLFGLYIMLIDLMLGRIFLISLICCLIGDKFDKFVMFLFGCLSCFINLVLIGLVIVVNIIGMVFVVEISVWVVGVVILIKIFGFLLIN